MSNYNIDLVFCLDLTADAYEMIKIFKENFFRMLEEIGKNVEGRGRDIEKLRIRIIGFKDFYYDDAIFETDFFTIPEQAEELVAFVQALECRGGGDLPENVLEAMALAFKSDWTKADGRRRYFVCVMTNSPALDLGERAGSPYYPEGMPKDMDELYDLYHSSVGEPGNKQKRLLIFAPDDCKWKEFNEWEFSYLFLLKKESDIEELLEEFLYGIGYLI